MLSGVFLFFFKQKTAYEMRISDWSSDVCSSDLLREGERGRIVGAGALKTPLRHYRQGRFAHAGASIAGFEEAPELGYVVVHRDRRGQMLSGDIVEARSEEHTSELQSLMRISYAVFCLKKKNQ